ncbi:hypothetical protein GGU45_001297 [Niabella hirudinis]
MALMLGIAIVACSKSEENKNPVNPDDVTLPQDSNTKPAGNTTNPGVKIDAAVGSWKLSETRISPGVPVDWGKIDNGAVLTFRDSSSYEIDGDKPLFWMFWPDVQVSKKGAAGTAARFRPTVIYLVPANRQDTAFFSLRISKDTLELWGLSCVEGCGYRFRKVE